VQFNFIASGGVPASGSAYAFMGAFATWANPFLSLPTGIPLYTGFITSQVWTDHTGTVNASHNTPPLSPGTGNVTVQQTGANISMQPEIPSINFRGRFHFPWMLPTDFDGDHLSATGITRLTPLANMFMTTWTFEGTTFTPAIWSRALGTMEPIKKATLTLKPSTVRKRGYFWDRSPAYPQWPFSGAWL
jgi:hypothetical protein